MTTALQDYRAAMVLLPVRMHSPQATVLLMAIQLQENPTREPQQIKGPAVGDYQHEKPTLALILKHDKAYRWARDVCAKLGVQPTADAVYEAIRNGDPRLDAAFARLLLWCDAEPLPPIGDVAAAWEAYLRVWRPGAAKRHHERERREWSVNYARALESMR